MVEYINGINPEILKWARERSGYSLEAAAKALNKDKSFIIECESGERSPTYIQLEKLADKYKRPVAVFFLPNPPEEEDLVDKLALRRTEVQHLEPRIHILLRQAYSRQLSLMELNNNSNPSEKKIFLDFNSQLNDPPKELGNQTRAYLNIDINTQTEWKNATDALENWRNCLEENGIYVFKDAFKDDSVDGFCLLHPEFPVIYLNNSRAAVRQIFTLFHELAHLLLGKNGVTRGINPNGGTIETFCNKFAAEFLVPLDDLEVQLKNVEYDDDMIEDLANRYKVSRSVILLKLVDKGIVSFEEYQHKVKGWTALYDLHKKKKSDENSQGGSYFNTQATYLGYKFMSLAFQTYNHGLCSIEELAGHLNVKVKYIPQFEDRLLKRTHT